MNLSSKIFDLLGLEPNEEFRILGDNYNDVFRITEDLRVQWRKNDGDWKKFDSSIELRWILLGRFSNGYPLRIVKVQNEGE